MQSQSNENESDDFSEEDDGGFDDEGDESDEGEDVSGSGTHSFGVENNGSGAFGQKAFAPTTSMGFGAGAPAFGAKASFGATTSAPLFGKPSPSVGHDPITRFQSC